MQPFMRADRHPRSMADRQCQHCGATYTPHTLADRNCGPGHWEMCPECGGMQHWLSGSSASAAGSPAEAQPAITRVTPSRA